MVISNFIAAVFDNLLREAAVLPQWYALQIRYQREKKALLQLSHNGIQTFLPSHTEVHRWTDRNRTVEVPMFSGYGFVQTNLSEAIRLHVLQTEGVLGFVAVHGKAIPIPDKQIEDLRLLVAKRIICAVHASPTTGQRVRIRGGCLDGLEGIVANVREDRMFVSLSALDRSLAICIQGYLLEAV
jgi:transcription antitermination factor NusG